MIKRKTETEKSFAQLDAQTCYYIMFMFVFLHPWITCARKIAGNFATMYRGLSLSKRQMVSNKFRIFSRQQTSEWDGIVRSPHIGDSTKCLPGGRLPHLSNFVFGNFINIIAKFKRSLGPMLRYQSTTGRTSRWLVCVCVSRSDKHQWAHVSQESKCGISSKKFRNGHPGQVGGNSAAAIKWSDKLSSYL